jgi:molybdenum-dependent DNA-binding transcriptional regulator ModE
MSAIKRPIAPDWGDIQFFLAVAEAGGIGQAAQRLGVNHSTVLRRIAQLEKQLGSRLFDRLPSGYALTAGGNALAEHLKGLADQVESAHRRLSGRDPAIEGSIRVTSSDIVVEGLLMPLLARFRRRHPAVQIQLLMNYGCRSPRGEPCSRQARCPPRRTHRDGTVRIEGLPGASRQEQAAGGTPLGGSGRVLVFLDVRVLVQKARPRRPRRGAH